MKNNYTASQKLRYALMNARGIPVKIDIGTYLNFAESVLKTDLSDKTDAELNERFKRLLESNWHYVRDENLTEIFAIISESSRRVLRLNPYTEQIAAGRILLDNNLIQMQTGEGKTLSAVFPAVIRAQAGKRIHIMTANEYLASRDNVWMGKVYNFLGITHSAVTENMTLRRKQDAYKASVVYLTAKQSGFDYLRDCGIKVSENKLHQPFESCIVDEADFIMIDEARIPLVIAREKQSSAREAAAYKTAADKLHEDSHFRRDRPGRKCILNPAGVREVCSHFQVDETSAEGLEAVSGVNVALHAHYLLEKNVDYIVREGKVQLVDSFTGRTADKREWPFGIQRALEAKENCISGRDGTICGRITIADFINLYPEKSAMTATAEQAAAEFFRLYGLKSFLIPPHLPVIREDKADLIFRTRAAKHRYMLKIVKERASSGQPVLIGTASVAESNEISVMLTNEELKHNVLNAEQDAAEAELIAAAGRSGALTVATNMAGRGTDIMLGGPEGTDSRKVRDSGGLYLISLNRFESKRIDNQLRGRSGRQGDPGTTQFMISLEDELFKKYGIEEFLPAGILDFPDDSPVNSPRAAREIARAQQIIEDQHSKMRETLMNYSAVIELYRKKVLKDRLDAINDGEFPLPLVDKILELESKGNLRPDIGNISGAFIDELDVFWSDFLEWNEVLKEGIHLRRLGKKEPLFEYIRDVKDEFRRGYGQMLGRTAERIAADNESLSSVGYGGEGSTWTYLIDDNPFPSFSLSMLGLDAATGAVAGIILLLLSPLLLLGRLAEKKQRRKKSNIKKI